MDPTHLGDEEGERNSPRTLCAALGMVGLALLFLVGGLVWYFLDRP